MKHDPKQIDLFPGLPRDQRLPTEATAAQRYQEPSLLTAINDAAPKAPRFKMTYYSNGRENTRTFNCLDNANKVAKEIFDKKGIVVGIEEM